MTGDGLTKYQHNWIEYMPFKALVLTATNLFLDWRRTKNELGYNPPDTDELLDAVQTLWDEMCERDDIGKCYIAVFHAPGMDQEALEQMMEMIE
jgi:hypothetical protein